MARPIILFSSIVSLTILFSLLSPSFCLESYSYNSDSQIHSDSQYEELFARKMFNFSVYAFCDDTCIIHWNCSLIKTLAYKIQDVKIFQNKSSVTFGYFGYIEQLDTILIVFRGTIPYRVQDDIIDLDYRQVDYPNCPGCKITRGFYHGYYSLDQTVLKMATEYETKFNTKKIIVLGYSMGAALAALAVPSLIVSGHKVSNAFLYGLFRVGNSAFARWTAEIYAKQSQSKQGKMFRITHHKDMIPHLPPKQYGYQHFSQQIFYDGNLTDGYVVCNDKVTEDPMCSGKYQYDLVVMNHLDYYDYHVLDTLSLCATPQPRISGH